MRPRSHAATQPPPRLVQTGSALPFTSNSTSTSTSPTPEEGKEATIPHRLLSSSFHFSFTTLLLCFSLPLPIVFRFLPPTCLRTSSFHRLGSGGPNFPRLKLAPNLASTTSCLALPATARNQPPTHETTAVDRRERKKQKATSRPSATGCVTRMRNIRSSSAPTTVIHFTQRCLFSSSHSVGPETARPRLPS